MKNILKNYLDNSYTAYQACENAAKILEKEGFTQLKENGIENLEKNKGYFVIRDGSSLIAFKAGDAEGFNIVASHSDSPCLKLKYNSEMKVENYRKFNVEKYGGGILYSFLDRPLKIAGRVVIKEGNKLFTKNFVSEKTFVIPSVCIHFNRTVNDGIKLNPQTDMSPIESIIPVGGLYDEIKAFAGKREVADCDLFVACAEKAFVAGSADELICSPRIDNLTSALSSLQALAKASPKAVNVAYIADNEEVGSTTKQGAGSKFLFDTLKKIYFALGKSEKDFDNALQNSLMVSFDNAHAVHPNHPELSDPTNKVLLGGGIVVKHNANQSYTTDAFSSSLIKTVFDNAGVKYQDFFNRSDIMGGGTLGAISSRQLSIKSVDIGLAQLAMHSALETFAYSDYEQAVKGLTAFYSSAFLSDGYNKTEII
ncbi:MAG: M18 family aminopeptidase [Clostridia bacterium]|nr:M18 family aminopeptidase [Clostridia bacterium]